MVLTVYIKYPPGSWVECQFKNSPSTRGRIQGVSIYKGRHTRPECYSLTYHVEPVEFVGGEHDEDEAIPECHVNGIPRIFGPYIPTLERT